MNRSNDAITFISKHFILRRPRVAILLTSSKHVTMFIKTIFKDSKKLKGLEIMYENAVYICIS